MKRTTGRRCKSCILLIMAGLFLAGWLTGPALAEEQDSPAVMDRIITIRNWKLMKEFNLRGEKAQEVFAVLDEIDARRARLIRKRRQVLQRLRKESSRLDPDEDRLAELISTYLEVMEELAAIPASELAGLEGIFSVRDRARFLLFSQDMAREIRRIMQNRADGRHPRKERGRPSVPESR